MSSSLHSSSQRRVFPIWVQANGSGPMRQEGESSRVGSGSGPFQSTCAWKRQGSEEAKQLNKGCFQHLGMEKITLGDMHGLLERPWKIWGKPNSAFSLLSAYLLHLKGFCEVHVQGHRFMGATSVCWSTLAFWTAGANQCLWGWTEIGHGFIFLKYFSDNIPSKNHSVGSCNSLSKGHCQLQ